MSLDASGCSFVGKQRWLDGEVWCTSRFKNIFRGPPNTVYLVGKIHAPGGFCMYGSRSPWGTLGTPPSGGRCGLQLGLETRIWYVMYFTMA